MPLTTTTLLEGLVFPEGPRWHDGRLWFSDMWAYRVMAIDLEGHAETIVEVPNRPSGLGWLPSGELLVVSMADHRLLRLENGHLVEHADLSTIAGGDCNDMVVDKLGRAYVGNFGFDYAAGQAQATTSLALVYPEGRVAVAADDLMFPNGAVITEDGGTLIVAETFANRLSAFDIAADGTLANRRVFAEVPTPDGICLDAEGAVWVASPVARECIRVFEGGRMAERIPVAPRGAFACMLGGDDRQTLFICTAVQNRENSENGQGWIETVRVDVPGAGRP